MVDGPLFMLKERRCWRVQSVWNYCLVGNFEQVHWGIIPVDTRDVCLCQGTRTLHHFHGYFTRLKKEEINAIDGRRFSEGISADREMQRTLESNEYILMDIFDYLGQTWYHVLSSIHSTKTRHS
jgi:hypothetical protein